MKKGEGEKKAPAKKGPVILEDKTSKGEAKKKKKKKKAMSGRTVLPEEKLERRNGAPRPTQ